MTLQIVLRPQLPGQGSRHFWLVHASFLGQSELITHSGLQVGGAPTNPLMQLHTACMLFCLHWLFGPHGDGLHGLLTEGATTRLEETLIRVNILEIKVWCIKNFDKDLVKMVNILMRQLFYIYVCISKIFSKNTWSGRTQDKSISNHSCKTSTHWNMIVYIAHCILATNTWTRIHAFVSHACLRVRAIVIQYALWATTAVWVSEIFYYASANSSVTLRIRSARRRCAWIRFRQLNRNYNNIAWEKDQVCYYIYIYITEKIKIIYS